MRGLARRLLWAGLTVAVVAALLALSGALGHRYGLWEHSVGFTLLRWSFYAAVAALALSGAGLMGAAHQRSVGLMLAAGPGVILALAVATVPLLHVRTMSTYPPIHDITTDTDNPPEFVALRDIREDAPNAVAYPGKSTARQQKQAYPDIRPLTLDVAPERAFRLALEQAEAMDWRVAEADADARRIEAVAETFWFGFRDDVAIRVNPTDAEGARIDVRSASRIGVSDLGTNAARIRAYLDGLRDRLSGE